MRISCLAVLTFAALMAPEPASVRARQAPEPVVFSPGVISDEKWQWRLTFTPDGRTAYFSESDGFFPASRKGSIYVSQRRGGAWSAPELAPFSGTHSDMDPFVTPDGNRLYFSSIRPGGGVDRPDLDLWMVEKRGRGWSDPVRLGPDVNSDADELYASASSDGTLYFASGPLAPAPGQHFDIFRARRAGTGFAAREALGPGVNTQPSASDATPVAAWEFNPEISADGTLLVFASLRPGGLGLGDLYASRFENGAWSAAVNLGAPVNTAADEYHPTLSRDGRQLYFVRRPGSHGDFFIVPVAAVPALRRP
ncbi:MAG: PD40 domain-containing protein [Acidobacteria bacterium]|nr:PD40 domain-containing protein [Acidobacteriota bacterium]